MRRTATTALAVASLALAGCTSDGEPTKTVTVTATQSPKLSDTETRQACVDAWLTMMTTDGYDPDAEPETPAACDGLSGQAEMYAEALRERNAANREELDECLADPSCTSMPIP